MNNEEDREKKKKCFTSEDDAREAGKKQEKTCARTGWGRWVRKEAVGTAGGEGNFTDKVHIYCLRHKEHGDSKE